MKKTKWIVLFLISIFSTITGVANTAVTAVQPCERSLNRTEKKSTEYPVEFLFELFKTSANIFKLKITGDRLIFRMAPTYKNLPMGLLSEEGKRTFLEFQRNVNPTEEINKIAERFHVDKEEAKNLILSNGDFWLRQLFSERNQGHWDKMIEIYNHQLSGSWQQVAEAKLQAALALNRRNQGQDRMLAIQYIDDVIRRHQGKSILSEAYGIRGRIIKDIFEESKTDGDVSSGDMRILDQAIESYRLGFESNPMDYYPGINVVNLSMYKGTEESIRYALDYAKKVSWAVNKTLQRYAEKKQPPDYWLLSTGLRLKILTNQWDQVSILLPHVLNSSAGSMNIQTSQDDYKKLLSTWVRLYGENSEPVIKLKFLIQTFENALKVDFKNLPLNESSMSYISTHTFPDMEKAFETDPYNLKNEIEKSQVGSTIQELSKDHEVQFLSFQKFLQTLVIKQGDKPNLKRGVLLAPTGPYKMVMQAIADNTGLVPWWQAYGELGIDLNSNNVEEFIKKLKEENIPIYFMIPKNFKDDHKDSHTLDEFHRIVTNFSELAGQVHFVFGFERTFPLNFKTLISEKEVRKNYRFGVLDYFVKRFQAWLIDLGSEVKSYKLTSEFNESLYPLVYDSVLENLSWHKELRKLHSLHMGKGTRQKRMHILDVGGGTGLVARQLIKDDPHRFVEIFDDSATMTHVARLKGIPENQVHISNALDLRRQDGHPVESNSIDGVTCSNMVYLLSRLQTRDFFKEVHRVLKKGARFSLSSMLDVPMEKHREFINKFTREIKALEARSIVGPGSYNIFEVANKNLFKNKPTLFSHEEITTVGRNMGFKVIVGNGSVYEDVGFFVVFEKE